MAAYESDVGTRRRAAARAAAVLGLMAGCMALALTPLGTRSDQSAQGAAGRGPMLDPAQTTTQAGSAVNATTAFLGPRSEWKDAAIVVQQASPLFGGREYYVSGTGAIVLVDVRRSLETGTVERRFELADQLELTNKLFATIERGDLLDPNLKVSTAPRPTCRGPVLFIVRNSKGEVHSVLAPEGATRNAYDEVLLDVHSLVRLAYEGNPVYEGDNDPTFIPKDFSWAAPIVGPRKNVSWTPFPTAEERARAEAEYERRVKVQLEEVARKRAKQEEANLQD